MNRCEIAAFCLGQIVVIACAEPSHPISKQLRDGEPVRELAAGELADLGDPLFELVLKDHADFRTLSQIEEALQPDASKRNIFVVHEDIVDPRRNQTRRAVLTYSGQRPNNIVLNSNVMLSVFFDSERFSDAPSSIEAWGWDGKRGRYNYYKLDNSGTQSVTPSWKFRASSVGADKLDLQDRHNTCLACHVNGAPVMKELLFPWNNWHSDISKSPAQYLKPERPDSWSVASSERFRTGLSDASNLEQSILAACQQFNRSRINSALKRNPADGSIETNPDGTQTVLEGRRLLRHLFEATEYNIISAGQRSGLHALPQLDRTGPSGNIVIPGSFFLNAELIAGGGRGPGYRGLALIEAREFAGDPFGIQPNEYKDLVLNTHISLHGQTSDANFAWFVPERSHVDNDMVDALMKLGAVSPQFVAASLAVDLENPLFSNVRKSLLRFVPDQFAFTPLQANQDHIEHFVHPDDLTRKTIDALRNGNVQPGTPEADWLALLQDPNPRERLRERVVAYQQRIKSILSDSAQRTAELSRLFSLLIDRRRAANNHPVLRVLDETDGRRLFPLPTP